MINLCQVLPKCRALCGIVLILLTTGSVQAHVTNAAWTNNTTWIYEIADMPDLDQRRAFLANTGRMYCGPTAVMNKMLYLGNHGYPELSPTPGPGNWQLQSRFDNASLALFLMGWMMEINPESGPGGGTSGLNRVNGARKWLNLYAQNPFAFTVHGYWKTGGYWPNIDHIAKTALTGGLVSFSFGRYNYVGNDPTSPTLNLTDRNGGHVITLAMAARSGNTIALESRDPAHEHPDFDLDRQSVFANRPYNVLTHAAFAGGTFSGIVHSLDATVGNDVVAIVDGYLAIVPLMGYGYTPGGHTISIQLPVAIVGSQSPALRRFDFSAVFGSTATIVDSALHPDMTSMFAIVNSAQGMVLAEMGAMTGEVSVLRELPEGRKLTLGRNRLLYVLEDDVLHQVHIDIVPEEPGDPPPIQSMELPFIADAIEFLDASDRLAVLSTLENTLVLYQTDPTTDALPIRPVHVEIATPLEGAAFLAVPPDPIDDKTPVDDPSLWIISEASDSIFRIKLDDGSIMEQISLTEISNPTSISVNDGGDLFVVTPEGLFQLSKPADDWMIVPSLFDGENEVLEQFKVVRSRTNYHPALHDGPGWENFEPEDEDVDGKPDDRVLRDRFEDPAAPH
jgi:hypothetical protein